MSQITNIHAWGMIPAFLSAHSDEPLWQQIHNNYAHGGGWRDFTGFTVKQGDLETPFIISYSGDPDQHEIGRIELKNQLLILFPHQWILWTDGTYTKIARID